MTTVTACAISSASLFKLSVPAPRAEPITKFPPSASKTPVFSLLPSIVAVPPSKSTRPAQVSLVPSITTPVPAAVDVSFKVEPSAIVKAAADVIAELLINSRVESP